jgi:hypothetical protein
MSESDFKKIRVHLRLLTVCVLVLIVLLAANLVHRTINPKATSFPRVQVINGKDGKDAQIDYDKINQLIQAQIAAIPKPQNGINGQNGTNGQSIQGAQGTQGVSIQGAVGATGAAGKDGQNGVDGLTLDVQVDPNTCKIQKKYTVADFWISIAQLPKPCEVLP